MNEEDEEEAIALAEELDSILDGHLTDTVVFALLRSLAAPNYHESGRCRLLASHSKENDPRPITEYGFEAT